MSQPYPLLLQPVVETNGAEQPTLGVERVENSEIRLWIIWNCLAERPELTMTRFPV